MKLRYSVFGAAAIALAASLTGLTGNAEAVTPRPAASEAHEIVNRDAYTQCMDFGSNAPGTVVGLYHCYSGGSQLWTDTFGLPDPYFDNKIRSVLNGMCMDLRSNDIGAPIVLSECRDGYTSQAWFLEVPQDEPPNTTYRLIVNENGLCADIGSKNPGTPVTMAVCRLGYKSQEWSFRYQ
jgi:hypothetical protein